MKAKPTWDDLEETFWSHKYAMEHGDAETARQLGLEYEAMLEAFDVPDCIQGPPRLFYTAAESEDAHEQWKASCGPHSIAAAMGTSLESVRRVLSNYKGWMSPTMMGETLTALGGTYMLTKGLKTQDLCNGINRIQWEGPWLNSGVPAKVAYFHTHWVAHFDGWILCTACLPDQWIPVAAWLQALLEEPGPSPFHITHHYELEPCPLFPGIGHQMSDTLSTG